MADAVRRHRQDWNDLAEFDAYWAVLTRRDRKYGCWDRREFFATGEAEVAAMLDRCADLGRPDGFGRALDYGCGLGRLSRALAGRFGECLGVDISERMVERARELNADRPNCALAVGNGADLTDLRDGSFDLVYCSLVLQHLPSVRLAEGLIQDFVRLLTPGGIAVFQMPSRIEWWARPRLRRRLYSVLRRIGMNPRLIMGLGRSNPMRMNAMPPGACGRWSRAQQETCCSSCRIARRRRSSTALSTTWPVRDGPTRAGRRLPCPQDLDTSAPLSSVGTRQRLAPAPGPRPGWPPA